MMQILLLIPFLLQALCIGIDEFYFHHQRGLPRWERIGHPIDTLTLIICFLFVLIAPFSQLNFIIYLFLAFLSCLMITKDEFVHKEHSPASEQWLHAILFINHSLILTTNCFIWLGLQKEPPPAWLSQIHTNGFFFSSFLHLQTALAILFCVYQIIYWNIIWKRNEK